jgi:3',5'-cyclic AMP phosphodiesterase CpdA
MDDQTRQVVIIHLSDIHFGKNHRFNPPATVAGDQPVDSSFPTLLGKLAEDLDGPDPGCPVIICITGDLVETADVSEFSQAEDFVHGLATLPILGKARGLQSIFVVPGNHDVMYTSSLMGARWQHWTDFYNRLFGTSILREFPWGFVKIHDQLDRNNVMVLSINSAIYVEKGKADEDRGRLDEKQLFTIEEDLENLDTNRLEQSIRVALIHHHPVLIPDLAEPTHGYDAVHSSGRLLSVLRNFGFHVILHGHKHNPYTFTDDSQSAFHERTAYPILISAGGSFGSTQLPNMPRSANCYNRIVVKWHPAGQQRRVQVETRGLEMFRPDGTERLASRWSWRTLHIDDRHFLGQRQVPTPETNEARTFDSDTDHEIELYRNEEYVRSRGNMPVVNILPSLDPDHAYEATLWIVAHPWNGRSEERDTPVEVTWSAGPRFDIIRITRDGHQYFCASYAYWGPMLVQARLRFSDGYEASTHVYVRMPAAYGID